MADSKLRVLLVDDDEEDYLITSEVILEIPGAGYHITWKSSFDAALEELATGVYDVLVFDYRLGGETGIDLLREVMARKYPAPVILLTGQHDEDIDKQAICLGALDYLIKGKITPDSFERSVRHALAHFRTMKQLHDSNAFLQSIIDALSSEVAILNNKEEILAVNRAWRNSFEGAESQSPESCDNVGFLTLADHLPDGGSVGSDDLLRGVRRVMQGEISGFYLEYPCITVGRHRWVIARVSSFSAGGEGYVVIAYEDITVRKTAELELERSRALLEDLSVRDELTSLYNRRYINIVIRDEFERSRRYEHHFALLMLDIDHFKSVNDTYGHQTGDEALKHVARLCLDGCRTTDCVARYGGEEIVFVLPETDAAEAVRFAERIRVMLEATPLSVNSGLLGTFPLHITASIGVAVFPESGDTVEALFAFADKGLYLAKSAGRNKVSFATD